MGGKAHIEKLAVGIGQPNCPRHAGKRGSLKKFDRWEENDRATKSPKNEESSSTQWKKSQGNRRPIKQCCASQERVLGGNLLKGIM